MLSRLRLTATLNILSTVLTTVGSLRSSTTAVCSNLSKVWPRLIAAPMSPRQSASATDRFRGPWIGLPTRTLDHRLRMATMLLLCPSRRERFQSSSFHRGSELMLTFRLEYLVLPWLGQSASSGQLNPIFSHPLKWMPKQNDPIFRRQ